jgi:RNA polymerase sigma factor (sigma-70 family)
MNTPHAGFVRHLRTLVSRQASGILPDHQLLESFLTQRSEASFAALVQRHGPMVLGVCRRVLRHTQDAEDAFQATFLVLARKAASIRKHESLGSWLHGVARHTAERLKSKAARRITHERRLAGRPAGDSIDDLTWRELRGVLDEELRLLPEKYRSPLVLCYLEGKTQDEAARQLDWSKGTFRRRLEQGRDALGRRLTRRGLALSAVLSVPLLTGTTAQAVVPPRLVEGTVRAGLALASGRGTAGLISAQVATLMEGGANTLLTAKAKAAVVLFAAVGLVAGGVFTHQTLNARPAAPPAASSPLRPKAAPERPAPSSAEKDRTVDIKGRVLDVEGKPLPGARLFLLSEASQGKSASTGRATTDKDGGFHFTARRDEVELGGKVVATAKEYGPDWMKLTGKDPKDELTLRLVRDDVPINGRVLDLEGRPVAGVNVKAVSLNRGDLQAWFEGTLAHRYPQLRGGIKPESVGITASVATGKDGRFRLTGLGRDRVVHLLLDGESIERGDFEVVTRHEIPSGLSRGNNGVYPARFDHVAGPGKAITGTIRDKQTGKALAGISVACPLTPSWIWATTDAQGRYRLTGVPKRKQYYVGAGGVPYFNCTKHDVADTPGLEPISVDFALERGVLLRGKLIDKVTGRPVHGRISFVALPDNPNLKDFTDFNKPQMLTSDPGRTKADGSFAVVAIPGPGLLCARADEDHHYLPAVVPEPRPKISNILEEYHAVVPIDPSEDNPKSLKQDIGLEPARTLKGSVVGPDGKPLAGAHVAGLSGVTRLLFGRTDRLDTDSFTVGGLDPKRPRPVVFVQAEKKLAKVQRVCGDESEPLTVRLEPLSAVAGRFLDADGKPLAGLKVTAALSFDEADNKDLPRELLLEYPAWSKVVNRETTTDAEGRFRIEGLVPGMHYQLTAKDGGGAMPYSGKLAPPEAGKTKDLGDLKGKS